MYAENTALSASESKSTTSIVQSSQIFTVNPYLSQRWAEPTEHLRSERSLTTVKSFEISVPDIKHQPDFRAYVSKIRSAPASLSFSKLKSRVKSSRERRSSDIQPFIPALGTHPNTHLCEPWSQYNKMNTRRSSMSSSNNSTYSKDLDSSSQSSETSSISPPRSEEIDDDDDELGFSIIKLQLSAQRIGRQRSKASVPPPSPADFASQKPQVLAPLGAELSICFDSPFLKNSTHTSIEPVGTTETPNHIIKQSVQPRFFKPYPILLRLKNNVTMMRLTRLTRQIMMMTIIVLSILSQVTTQTTMTKSSMLHNGQIEPQRIPQRFPQLEYNHQLVIFYKGVVHIHSTCHHSLTSKFHQIFLVMMVIFIFILRNSFFKLPYNRTRLTNLFAMYYFL